MKKLPLFLDALKVSILLFVAIFIMSSCENPLLSKNRDDEIIEVHSFFYFLDKTYLEYNGGKEAEAFFDEYADTNKYIDIDFHYKDGEKGNYINKKYYGHTVFALDVYYDRDTFLQVSDRILLEITGESAEDIFKSYDGKNNVAFSGYKIEKNNSLYEENSAAVLFDPRYNTIRYVFLCNKSVNVFYIQEAVSYTLDLSDNDKPKNWIFDYSDIASEDYAKYYKPRETGGSEAGGSETGDGSLS